MMDKESFECSSMLAQLSFAKPLPNHHHNHHASEESALLRDSTTSSNSADTAPQIPHKRASLVMPSAAMMISEQVSADGSLDQRNAETEAAENLSAQQPAVANTKESTSATSSDVAPSPVSRRPTMDTATTADSTVVVATTNNRRSSFAAYTLSTAHEGANLSSSDDEEEDEESVLSETNVAEYPMTSEEFGLDDADYSSDEVDDRIQLPRLTRIDDSSNSSTDLSLLPAMKMDKPPKLARRLLSKGTLPKKS